MAISMYQSQKLLQMKSYRLYAPMPRSKDSKLSVSVLTISLKRVRIHLSLSASLSADGTPSGVKPCMFISAKRLAFQILLAKLR